MAEMIRECRANIDQLEPDIRAFETLDWEFVERQMATVETQTPEQRGCMYGVPVGIKDVFDTADLPTGYGSDLYTGYQPAADAAVVARLRAAGAIVVGKTVSTEFAYWKAGKTRNPKDLARTPGGSSAGSAAAVAAGMVPVALGTQTAASTIRPASYCGVVGFKPSWGQVSTAGIKSLAQSMDTVGFFAQTVGHVQAVASILTRDNLSDGKPTDRWPPRLAILQSPEWQMVTDQALEVVKRAGHLAQDSGAIVQEGKVPPPFESLAEHQTHLMAFEAVRELAHERYVYFDRLSQPLQNLLIQGENVTAREYRIICDHRDLCLSGIDEMFGDADALLAPSTLDVAPLMDEGTGDPVMCRAWTLLGLPAITIPFGSGKAGLPFGLQIACRPGQDARLLSIARWFERLTTFLPIRYRAPDVSAEW